MSKKNTSVKLYDGKPQKDLTVGYGKYKTKTLLWVAKNDYDFFLEIEKLYYPKYSLQTKKYYDETKKRFAENNGLITGPAVHERVHQAVKLLKERKTSAQVREILSPLVPSTLMLDRILTDANHLIRKEFELQKDSLVDTHLLRYEELYHDSMSPNLEHVAPGYRKAMEAESYMTAMDTLFQKERLLGIHTKKYRLKASKISIKEHTKNADFNLSHLTFNEQLELFSLLQKAKPVEDLIRPIINDNPLNIDTKAHQQVEEVIEAPIQQAKQTDIIGDEQSKQKTSRGKSLLEVQQSMQNSLMKKIEEAYKRTKK